MKKIAIFIFAILCINTLIAQSPEKYSIVSFPFEISLSNLSRDIDNSIGEVILRDKSLTDNNNDQLQYNIVKTGPIKLISIKNHLIKIIVPIRVWAQKGIGAFGMYQYGDTKFEMELKFKIAYSINPDWTLKTKTFADGYRWLETPKLNVNGVAISLTTIFDQVLKYQQPNIAKTIDEQIAENVNVKDNVTELWNSFKEPMLLSDSFQTWMTISPIDIFATPFEQNSKSIKTTLAFKLLNNTYFGNKPSHDDFPIAIPSLTYVKSLPEDFKLTTSVHLPYTYLNNEVEKMYPTFDIDYGDNKKIVLSDIKLSSVNNLLKINCNSSGAFRGKIELLASYYDPEDKSIKVKNIDFDYSTKNLLHISASWIFNGMIEKKLEKKFVIPLGDELEEMKSMTEMGLTSYKSGVYTICNVKEMEPKDIEFQSDQIFINIQTIGNLSVSY